MRTGERGMSTGKFAGIIVAVAVVSTVIPVAAVVILTNVGVDGGTSPYSPPGGEGTGGDGGGDGGGGGALSGLPVYPGAASYDLPSGIQVPEGAQANAYSTSASVSEILTWYKGQMPGQGWTLDSTNSQEEYGFLVYTKGDDAAAIYAYSYGGTTLMILATGPTSVIIGGT